MFFEHQISALEWFLKDNLTLKPGVMAAENSALPWVCIRGWTTCYFLKSTFMWWKSSQSRLSADDVINEQLSLQL